MERFMKMKQLRACILEDGFDVTQRMVKYYIDTGLLPQPIYTEKNQALYNKYHIARLETILNLKKKGMSFSKIKEWIFALEELQRAKAALLFDDPLRAQNYAKESLFAAEREDLLAQKAKDFSLHKEELLERYELDRELLRLSSESGILQEKDRYDRDEILLLLKAERLLHANEQEKHTSHRTRLALLSQAGTLGKMTANFLITAPLAGQEAAELADAVAQKELHLRMAKQNEKTLLFSPQHQDTTGKRGHEVNVRTALENHLQAIKQLKHEEKVILLIALSVFFALLHHRGVYGADGPLSVLQR